MPLGPFESKAAMQAWQEAGYPVAAPSLKEVPPCRDCGHVPTEYARFDDGTVQCAGEDRKACHTR